MKTTRKPVMRSMDNLQLGRVIVAIAIKSNLFAGERYLSAESLRVWRPRVQSRGCAEYMRDLTILMAAPRSCDHLRILGGIPFILSAFCQWQRFQFKHSGVPRCNFLIPVISSLDSEDRIGMTIAP